MQTFGPSRFKVAVTGLACAYLWWATIDDFLNPAVDRRGVALDALAALGFTALLAWLLSLRLTLSAERIEYSSMFSTKALRLADVREIYSWAEFRKAFYVIPTWPACRFELRTATGARLVFGSLLTRARFAGFKTILLTTQHIANRAAEQFNRGGQVAFGPIKISQKGVYTDGWKTGLYPWSEVEGIEESVGGVFVKLSGNRSVGGRGRSFVPNVEVLTMLVSMAVELTRKGAVLQFPVHKPPEKKVVKPVPPH